MEPARTTIKRRYKEHETYKVNHLQFSKNFTAESVYLLGLLWADGYLSSDKSRNKAIYLTQVSPDSTETLEILNKTGLWGHYVRNPNAKHPTWKTSNTFYTSNPYLWDFLRENNYHIKSESSACKILKKIPENLCHFWFRGLFDGDGHCAYYKGKKYSVSIASSKDQDWSYMKELSKKILIKNFYISKRTSKTNHSSSHFAFSSAEDCLSFLNFIYADRNDIGLSRKYSSYLNIQKNWNLFINQKFKGVCLTSDKKRWRAYITAKYSPDGKMKDLGKFPDEKSATNAVADFIEKNNIIIGKYR